VAEGVSALARPLALALAARAKAAHEGRTGAARGPHGGRGDELRGDGPRRPPARPAAPGLSRGGRSRRLWPAAVAAAFALALTAAFVGLAALEPTPLAGVLRVAFLLALVALPLV